MDATMNVVTLYPRLIDGDLAVLAAFAPKATVDSPLMGHQQPPEFVADARSWLEAHEGTVQDVATTVTAERVVHEFILGLAVEDGRVELPVMLVADIEDDCIRDLRVYHSTWPLTGGHRVRPPLMQYDLEPRLAPPLDAYHAALAAGDAAAADAVFSEDGMVREPAGGSFVHSGAERTAWYEAILSSGPLELKLGAVTDDGETLIYEYEVERWGAAAVPPQAGAAAYQRDNTGHLIQARIYDDIEPPGQLVRPTR